MTTANVATASGAPAGFLLRLVAAIIDGIILGIVVGIITAILMSLLGAQSMVMVFVVSYIIGGVLSLIYWAKLESGTNQATLGKKVMKIKVTRVSGGALDFGGAAARSWVHWAGLFVVAIGFLIGLDQILGLVFGILVLVVGLSVAFKGNKQGFHDDWAGAQVVRA